MHPPVAVSDPLRLKPKEECMRAFLTPAVAAVLTLTAIPAHAAPAAPSIVSGSFYHAKFEGRRTACGDRLIETARPLSRARDGAPWRRAFS